MMSNEHFDRFGETKTDQRLSLCSLQWDYNRELALLGGFKPLPDAIENLYMSVRRGLLIEIMGQKENEIKLHFQVHKRRQADLVSYKKDTWIMVNMFNTSV